MNNLNLYDKIKVTTGVFKNKSGHIKEVLNIGYYIELEDKNLLVDTIRFYGNELEKYE